MVNLEVGQEYIDKHSTVYRIEVIGNGSVVSYSICDNAEKNAYYHAYRIILESAIVDGSWMPLTPTSRLLYGK